MKNAVLFIIIFVALIGVMTVGLIRPADDGVSKSDKAIERIPSLGRVQVMNGCGQAGAGNKIADLLRSRRFDVKDIENVVSGNYPYTYVISRKKDMIIARQIAQVLTTEKVFMVRNGDESYDVTVFVGSDYAERIRVAVR